MAQKGLMQRLNSGEKVVCAEGYIFNFEKRCYIQAGPFVPEVVLEHPDLVKLLHEEFVYAGSDVVQALTYYAHREKMDLISRNQDLEDMNRKALQIAREVAQRTGTLLAGDICNTNVYNPKDPKCKEKIMSIFKEQIEWAVEEGVDYIVAETFGIFQEALYALEAIQEYGQGVPSVITLAPHFNYQNGRCYTLDDVVITEAMKRLESAGANVVGLNCSHGPDTIIPLMAEIKKSGVKVPLACLPVMYRTTPEEPSFMSLTDLKTGKKSFPLNLDCHSCTRNDVYEFGRKCDEIGIQYIGLCCGNSPHYTRVLCESLGRRPPASKYSPDMSLHCVLGTNDKVDTYLRKNIKEKLTG